MQILLGVFKPTEGFVVLEFDDNSVMEISPKTRPLFSYVPQETTCLVELCVRI